MYNKEFLALATKHVYEWTVENSDPVGPFDVYTVWLTKVLQNNKALLATNLSDGKYFEVTYNGDKEQLYFDVYDKVENIAFKIED